MKNFSHHFNFYHHLSLKVINKIPGTIMSWCKNFMAIRVIMYAINKCLRTDQIPTKVIKKILNSRTIVFWKSDYSNSLSSISIILFLGCASSSIVHRSFFNRWLFHCPCLAQISEKLLRINCTTLDTRYSQQYINKIKHTGVC